MAIETTRFTQANNMSQIANWLNENAVPEYFDEVTFDDSTITCSMGDTAYYKINFYNNVITHFIKGKGTPSETSFTAYQMNDLHFDYAVKTSGGIMLHTTHNSCEMVITKTDSDGVAFIFTDRAVFKTYYYSGGNYYPQIRMLSVEKSSAYSQFPTTSQQNHGEMKTAKTVPAPIVIGMTGDYCPNCFHLPSNQPLGEECEFQLNGVNYYSNGYIALKE